MNEKCKPRSRWIFNRNLRVNHSTAVSMNEIFWLWRVPRIIFDSRKILRFLVKSNCYWYWHSSLGNKLETTWAHRFPSCSFSLLAVVRKTIFHLFRSTVIETAMERERKKVSVAYSRLLPDEVCSAARLRFENFHPPIHVWYRNYFFAIHPFCLTMLFSICEETSTRLALIREQHNWLMTSIGAKGSVDSMPSDVNRGESLIQLQTPTIW